MNIITQSGNIGQDCETRFTPAGKAISSFSLATTCGFGENKKTTWVSCKLFGERWANVSQYLTKGSKVTVTGSFTIEEWEHEGKHYSKPVILVNDLDLPPRSEGGQSNQTAKQPSHQGQQPRQQQSKPPMVEPDFDMDDSIPF